MNKFLLVFVSTIPSLATTIYSDGTFSPANWQSITLAQAGSAQLLITQQSSGGNPGEFQQVDFSFGRLAAGGEANANVARFHSGFTWNPATDGPLGNLRFSMDLRNFSTVGYSSPVSMFWRPVVLQDGLTFSVLFSSLSPTPNGSFETLNWDFTSSSNWTNFEDINLKPDFSGSGSILTFGYRVQLSGACPTTSTAGCTGATLVEGLDNYRVELTAQEPSSEVPEPSTWVIAASGLLLAARCRSTSGTRKDGAGA